MKPDRPTQPSDLSRREFLERTAYAAGLAGLASLPAGPLLAEAAEASLRSSGLPSPRNVPIDHFVLLMMENRSFDHYFGWLDGHADASQRQRYRNPAGELVRTRPASTLGTGGVQFKGCGHPDPGHGWDSGRAQLLGGFLAEGSGNDEFALTFYDRGELGFIHEAARKYTLYDRYFCSVLASTWPNRYYKWSAQSGGVKNNVIAPGGNNWENIFDRATARGLTVRYYYSDLPFGALWGARATRGSPPSRATTRTPRRASCRTSRSLIPPSRTAAGETACPPTSTRSVTCASARPSRPTWRERSPNHPTIAVGPCSSSMTSGAASSITSDPRGRPTIAPARTSNEDFGQMGFRVPAIALSPHARNLPRKDRGRSHQKRWRVDHGRYGHESILSFISYRFGLGYLNTRHQQARNIGHSFNWERADLEAPQLPDPPAIVTRPCALGGQDVEDSQQAHEGDLAKLEAQAERLGQPVYDAKPHEIFSSPDSVRKGLLAAP